MADLDLTDAITAVEFQDTFTVTSTARVIGDDGVPVDTVATPVSATGVVLATKASRMQRLPDGSRVDASIDIYSRYPLTNGSKTDDVTSQGADIVTWRSRQYTVTVIEDYSRFGQGFIHAQADLLPMNPAAAA